MLHATPGRKAEKMQCISATSWEHQTPPPYTLFDSWQRGPHAILSPTDCVQQQALIMLAVFLS